MIDINWNILLFIAFFFVVYLSYIQSDYESDESCTLSIYVGQKKPSKPANRPKVSKSSRTQPKKTLQAPKVKVKKPQPAKKHPFLEDAVLALRGLGHKKSEAYKIVNVKLKEQQFENLEDLVMECLK